MTQDTKDILRIFAVAVTQLLGDKELAYADPSERAIVARLAELLKGKYEGWSIDLEWNRREDVIKRLTYALNRSQLIKEGAIVPDLIVHRVGKKENLLVVEVKKAENRNFEGDIWKLKGMTELTGAYAYAVGVHLVVDITNGLVPQSDVYIDAEWKEDITEWLRLAIGGAD